VWLFDVGGWLSKPVRVHWYHLCGFIYWCMQVVGFVKLGKIMLLWDVTPHSLVGTHQHVQTSLLFVLSPNSRFLKALVPTYQTTQCNTTEHRDLNVQYYAVLNSTGWWAAMVQNKAGSLLHLVTIKSLDFMFSNKYSYEATNLFTF